MARMPKPSLPHALACERLPLGHLLVSVHGLDVLRLAPVHVPDGVLELRHLGWGFNFVGIVTPPRIITPTPRTEWLNKRGFAGYHRSRGLHAL